MTLERLFPDEDYRFYLRFERATPEEFFRPTAAHRELLTERRHWLGLEPRRYSALLPSGGPLLDETLELARNWKTLDSPMPASTDGPETAGAVCVALGTAWEPDFLLLQSGPDGAVRLLGGCVCFPSSWSLQEKVGKLIESIHDVVPGLNNSIGPQIHAFLSKLKPDVAWLRSNWGLSRTAELNQHPARNLPRLDETVRLGEVWLRVENQALVSLPRTNGVLFGIRITLRRLDEICSDQLLKKRLIRALSTMPAAVARYKGLESARGPLLQLLRS